jgi:hypothetical protein
VDTVAQREIACCVEKTSERYLRPSAGSDPASVPLSEHHFRSDNGSEFINRRVAEMPEGLLIEFTKSRATQERSAQAVLPDSEAPPARFLAPSLHIITYDNRKNR